MIISISHIDNMLCSKYLIKVVWIKPSLFLPFRHSLHVPSRDLDRLSPSEPASDIYKFLRSHPTRSLVTALVTSPAPPVSGICFIPLSGTSLSGPNRLPGNKIRTFTTVTCSSTVCPERTAWLSILTKSHFGSWFELKGFYYIYRIISKHKNNLFQVFTAKFNWLLFFKLCSHLNFSPLTGSGLDSERTSPRRLRWGAGRGWCGPWAGSPAGGHSAPPWSPAPGRWQRLSVSSWASWETSLWWCRGRNY